MVVVVVVVLALNLGLDLDLILNLDVDLEQVHVEVEVKVEAEVEASLGDFRVEASQGSHFFQNITSFRVAYLTVEPSVNDGTYDVEFLDAQPAVYEDEFVRHVRFDTPARVKVDGRRSSDGLKAVILKPAQAATTKSGT